MNVISNVLLVIAVVCAFAAVASAVMIGASLQKRGIAVNWIWFRVGILSRYLGLYRDVTRREAGQTGPLFYAYIIAINLTLVAAVAGLLFRAI